jgi:peptidoglycan/xylan/chitin deacetylase (PgdA/CDA1 family)
MTRVALLYHDIINGGDFQSSGFPSAGARIYKLPREEFRRHLDAIASANPNVLLTFDDGGVSFYETIAPALEEHGWRGYFFIATNWIGSGGFLSANQIRDLRNRGHLIGTHSCSHPERISHCSYDQILSEWSQSADILADVLGEVVDAGSVPGGYYSRRVAQAAASAGLRTLFTSEPTLRVHSLNGLSVLGRFTIRQGDAANTAAALASRALLPRIHQSASWNTKKLLKAAGGTAWLKFRDYVLDRS